MKIYQIPNNYKDPGYVLKGMVPLRNAIDAVVLGIVGYLFASLFHMEGEWAISWYILCIGLPAMLGLFGVHGIPLSTYLLDFLKWYRRREPCFYNHHGCAYSSTAADVMLSSPQLRDHVAAFVDKLTQSMKAKQVNYVEGENFQFAEDPELTILQDAENEANAESEETPESTTVPEQKPAVESASADKPALDFDNILDNIALSEIEETSHGD